MDKIGGLLSRRNEFNTKEEFFALKNISFEVEAGERVGIIGRNGAGKSTLLKILSRITSPSTGKISLHGRVSSLLEVGTGFHPELTGRENIYLNGAILGMSRSEIAKKFDDIVDFAEVEKFLDTPVKRFSSGMYVRLAFAVAAHLDQEIMIIDEVLAVGDAAFQKKCIGKMENVSKESGRTILFVSHNSSALKRICNKGILLDKGQVITAGGLEMVLNKYEQSIETLPFEFGCIESEFFSVKIKSKTGDKFYYNKDLSLEVQLFNKSDRNIDGVFSIAFDYLEDIRCLTIDTRPDSIPPGPSARSVYFAPLAITPGLYKMTVLLRNESNTVNYWQSYSYVNILSDQDTSFDIANCKNTQGGYRSTALLN